MKKYCILHSTARQTVRAAAELDICLQQKLSSEFYSGRFQLQDETNSLEACRELEEAEFVVFLLDSCFLSILDHKKSKRLYAKIADLLKPGCLVNVFFINVDVDGPKLEEFKEDFDNKDRMAIASYTRAEEICNYCYNNYKAMVGPTESEDSFTGPLTASSLESQYMNRLDVSSLLEEDGDGSGLSRPWSSGGARQPSALVPVENDYSSAGSCTTGLSISDQESYGRQPSLSENKPTDLRHSLPNLTKLQHIAPRESSLPLPQLDQLTITEKTVTNTLKSVEKASDERSPGHTTYGSHGHTTYGLPRHTTSGLPGHTTSGLPRHTTSGLPDNLPALNELFSAGVSGPQQPFSAVSNHGNSTAQDYPFHQNHPLSTRNALPNPRVNGDLACHGRPNPQPECQTDFPVAYQNAQSFQAGYQNPTISGLGSTTYDSHANFGHGRRLAEDRPHLVGHDENIPRINDIPQQGTRSTVTHPLQSFSNTSSNNSNITSYVQYGYSLPSAKRGSCFTCKKQDVDLVMPVMQGIPDWSSMPQCPSYGPEAMPCLSGFGICTRCAISSLERPSHSVNLPSFQTNDLKSMLESEERIHSVDNNMVWNIGGKFPVPDMLPSMTQQPSAGGRTAPDTHCNIPPSHNTGNASQLTQDQSRNMVQRRTGARKEPEKRIVSLPSNTETGHRSAGEGRSTLSMPDILSFENNSYSAGLIFQSVTDNTKMPGGFDEDDNTTRKKQKDSGTSTCRDDHSLGAAGGAPWSNPHDDGSGAANQVSIFELSKDVFGYIRDILDSSEQYNWTDLATLHGWNYGQIYNLKQKFKKRMIDSPFEYLMEEFQNYTVQQLKEDLTKIPRRDVLDKLRRLAKDGKLPANCVGLFT